MSWVRIVCNMIISSHWFFEKNIFWMAIIIFCAGSAWPIEYYLFFPQKSQPKPLQWTKRFSGQWLWRSWYSGCFRRQISAVRIQSSENLFTCYQLNWKGENKQKREQEWSNFKRFFIWRWLFKNQEEEAIIKNYHQSRLFQFACPISLIEIFNNFLHSALIIVFDRYCCRYLVMQSLFLDPK